MFIAKNLQTKDKSKCEPPVSEGSWHRHHMEALNKAPCHGHSACLAYSGFQGPQTQVINALSTEHPRTPTLSLHPGPPIGSSLLFFFLCKDQFWFLKDFDWSLPVWHSQIRILIKSLSHPEPLIWKLTSDSTFLFPWDVGKCEYSSYRMWEDSISLCHINGISKPELLPCFHTILDLDKWPSCESPQQGIYRSFLRGSLHLVNPYSPALISYTWRKHFRHKKILTKEEGLKCWEGSFLSKGGWEKWSRDLSY